MRPVWASGEVWSSECPRSFISVESLTLLDAYAIWKCTGFVSGAEEMPARLMDAIMTIQAEESAELRHGNRKD